MLWLAGQCRLWAQGFCKFGDKFAHGPLPSVPGPAWTVRPRGLGGARAQLRSYCFPPLPPPDPCQPPLPNPSALFVQDLPKASPTPPAGQAPPLAPGLRTVPPNIPNQHRSGSQGDQDRGSQLTLKTSPQQAARRQTRRKREFVEPTPGSQDWDKSSSHRSSFLL